MNRTVIKDASYRPQVAFLPLAPTRGSGPVLPQKPSWRYKEEQRLKREEDEKRKRAQGAALGLESVPV